MVTNLVVAINLASASGFSSAGQANLLNDLIPLLSDACKPQGTNISAMRALLRSFNSAQSQLQNLPAGFALMMTYNDYGNKILTGPGLPSAMQRLLGIMQRSNGCSPPILGNLAQLFLDTMAGNNQPILGIKLDIKHGPAPQRRYPPQPPLQPDPGRRRSGPPGLHQHGRAQRVHSDRQGLLRPGRDASPRPDHARDQQRLRDGHAAERAGDHKAPQLGSSISSSS